MCKSQRGSTRRSLGGMSEFALPSPARYFTRFLLARRDHCYGLPQGTFARSWIELNMAPQGSYTLSGPLFQVPGIRANYSFVSTILQPRANYKHVECLKHATGRSYRVRLAMLLTHSLFLLASTRTPMRTQRNPLPAFVFSFFLSLSFQSLPPRHRNLSCL